MVKLIAKVTTNVHCVDLHVKCVLSFSDLKKKLESSRKFYSKISPTQNVMKILPTRKKFVYEDKQKQRRTDMIRVTVDLCSVTNSL
jgi:esterase/lipase